MRTTRRAAGLVVVAWLAMLGFDFLLHGGLLARFYVADSPFLLEPMEALRRVPLGYLSFLLVAVLLYWLMTALGTRGGKDGLVVGLKAGALLWGSSALGLWSITTADPALLAGWGVGQAVEIGVAGAVLGLGLAGASLKRLFGWVLLGVFAAVVVTVILQSTGLAPQIHMS